MHALLFKKVYPLFLTQDPFFKLKNADEDFVDAATTVKVVASVRRNLWEPGRHG